MSFIKYYLKMSDVIDEINKINLLEINNCHLVIQNIPLNILIKYNEGENSDKLNKILEIINLFKNKINDKMIIDLNFIKDKDIELPKEVSFYQSFLVFFCSFINLYYTYNQFILIRFPQLLLVNNKDINFDCLITIDSSKNEININEKNYNFNPKKSNIFNIAEKIISQINESELLNNYKLFQYNFTCLAGTFDRCHRGHFLLIQTSLLLCKSHWFLGVCSDEMIKHKGPFSLLQTNYVRRKKIEELVNINGKNKDNCKYDIGTIYDAVDMAGIEKDLECLIVTTETHKGGLYCNEVRKKNNIKPVDICTVNVIKINLDEEKKISSSIIRKEILSIAPIEKINKINLVFKNLCTNIKCKNEDLINYWWNEILNQYTKKWKYYHNINHIYSFIELYDKYNNLIEREKNEFLLSIFFHDIIYIPSRNDNEKESIKLLNKFYIEAEPKDLNKEKMIELIAETQNHLLNKEYKEDINLFLDMDMQIIAQENWEEYEDNIRKEYSFIDYNIYKIKRKEFLESLAKKEKIFRTKTFYELFEKSGRNNIKNIIDKLN